MDTLSTVILLLVAFIGWSQNIDWLFWAGIILIIITIRSIGIIAVMLAGIFAMYYFGLERYWFILLVIIIGLVLYKSERKGKESSEYYSPELMKLLGGG